MATLEVYQVGPLTLLAVGAPALPDVGADPRMRVFVIDVSGSMSSPAVVLLAGGAREETGRTILDVVCDAVIAAIATLGPNDSAAIVVFSDFATVRLPETIMTPEGKDRARMVLRSLAPGGSTHLWDGIEKGMDLVRGSLAAGSRMARCASVDVLTDGMPNMPPANPSGFVTSLRDYFDLHRIRPLVNCLGFGSNIQHDVLDELAREGGGHFSFIPSPDMVATNFVNSAAAFGSAFDATPMVLYGVGPGSTGTKVPGLSLGLIPYGSRVFFLISLPPGTPLSSLALITHAGVVSALERNPDEHTVGAVCVAEWRKKLVNGLRQMIILGNVKDFAGALKLARDLSEGIRAEPKEPLGAPAATALLNLVLDVESQVAICLSRPDYFSAWGSAYLLSLARAHELQLCANFKDLGLQGYATPVFTALQTTAARVFRAALAAAMAESAAQRAGGGRAHATHSAPHSASHSAPGARAAAAAALFDPAGGCVHGEGMVNLPNDLQCRVSELKVGMSVVLAHPPKAIGTVTHIVRTRTEPGVACVALSGGLVGTAWHPVFLDGKWCFPASAPDACVVSKGTAAQYPSATYMYSWAVVGYDCVRADGKHYGSVVDGTPIITLAHGVSMNDVLSHPFFGTCRVLENLERMQSWCAANGIDYSLFAVGNGQWRWNHNEATGEVSIVNCKPLYGVQPWCALPSWTSSGKVL